jgi:hypothetical protein
VESDTTSSLAAAAFALCIEKRRCEATHVSFKYDLHFQSFSLSTSKRPIFIACLPTFPFGSLIFIEVWNNNIFCDAEVEKNTLQFNFLLQKTRRFHQNSVEKEAISNYGFISTKCHNFL